MGKFFSISKNDTHKILNILGLKLKFRLNQAKYNYAKLNTILNYMSEIHLFQMINTFMKDDILKIYYRDEEIKFYLPNVRKDTVQTTILKNNTFFEVENLEYIKKYINNESYVLDAGANIGNHTIYYSRICNAKKVFSFEPQRHIFNVLKRNIELNSLENVELFNCGLGEKECKASISKAYSYNLGGTAFTEDENGGYPIVALDDMKFEKLDFCKIDVEGYQLALLKGAKETLAKFKPVICIEMLDKQTQSDCDEMRENILPKKLLEEYGYVLKEKISDWDYLYIHKDNLSQY